MAAPTKNQKIESLVKLVQKRCRGTGLSQPPQRTVLETLMYAALLENAAFDKAETAYTVLENYYIDWNEIRVCSVRELADTLMDLPEPEAAAERIRKALQGIFEKTYMFDLEEMRKKGKALAEHVKALESMSASPYMVQYTAQVALDGHLIPLDEASFRIMRRLGLSQVSSDGTQEICTGLERVVLKKSGLTFTAQLHHFAAGYYDVPDSPELLSQLSAIDPEAVSRSWISPILVKPSVSSKPAATAMAPSVREAEKEAKSKVSADKLKASKESSKISSTKSTKPVQPPAKRLAKSALAMKGKSSAKPVKKPAKKLTKKRLPTESAAKTPKKPIPKKTIPKKPVKSAANTKKTLLKGSKGSPNKKALNKKTLHNKTAKAMPPKKTIVIKKKGLTKPVKKPKAASPSKALRKKKPK